MWALHLKKPHYQIPYILINILGFSTSAPVTVVYPRATFAPITGMPTGTISGELSHSPATPLCHMKRGYMLIWREIVSKEGLLYWA
jgi:hypothetical protein